MEIKTLKGYLAEIGMSLTDFGQIIEYNPRYLRQVALGKMIPSEKLARNICRATGGVINLSTRPKRKKTPKGINNENNTNVI